MRASVPIVAGRVGGIRKGRKWELRNANTSDSQRQRKNETTMLKQILRLTTLMLGNFCVMFFCMAMISNVQITLPAGASLSHVRARKMETRRDPMMLKILSANSYRAEGVISATPTLGREARRDLDDFRLWANTKHAHIIGAPEERQRGDARRFDLPEFDLPFPRQNSAATPTIPAPIKTFALRGKDVLPSSRLSESGT